MTAEEKKKYRTTKAWKEFRLLQLEDAHYTCFICSVHKKKGLQVHHIDEAKYGREQMGDVVVLCSRCHQLVEQLLRRKDFSIDRFASHLTDVYMATKGLHG